MDSIVTACEHCSARFEAPARLAGGYANCSECGKATLVPGGTDQLWLAIVTAFCAFIAVATVIAFTMGGPAAGIATPLVLIPVGLLLKQAM